MDAFTYVVGLKKDLRQRNFFLMKIKQLYFVSVGGRLGEGCWGCVPRIMAVLFPRNYLEDTG